MSATTEPSADAVVDPVAPIPEAEKPKVDATESQSTTVEESNAKAVAPAGEASPEPSNGIATTSEPKIEADEPAKEATEEVAATTKKPSEAPAESTTDQEDTVNPIDFQGTVDSNNDIPTPETLRKIENYVLLDRDGKSHTFKSLYSGKHVARRVLIIFVRHFYCGNCQEYLRTLSASITPEALLRLPISTFIAIVGCGDPALIDMYATASNCPFPVYADPTRKLYDELGMIRSLALGSRPAYMKKSLLKSSLDSVVQGLKQIKNGLVTKGGDQRQIGGEFLFEPLDFHSPVTTPWNDTDEKKLGLANGTETGAGESAKDDEESGDVEEKRVTWCHRMKNTRDHAEIPELMEVLGLDGQGQPIQDKKRWSKALGERKGTGLSMARQMSELQV